MVKQKEDGSVFLQDFIPEPNVCFGTRSLGLQGQGSQLNLVQNPKQSTGAWAKMTSALSC